MLKTNSFQNSDPSNKSRFKYYGNGGLLKWWYMDFGKSSNSVIFGSDVKQNSMSHSPIMYNTPLSVPKEEIRSKILSENYCF